jgi:hypothetical protein
LLRGKATATAAISSSAGEVGRSGVGVVGSNIDRLNFRLNNIDALNGRERGRS